MAARPRDIKNRKLPANLYPNGKYWRYRNPITGLMTSINRPLEEAIKLAKAANAKLAPLMVNDGALLTLLTGDRLPTVSNLLERFADEWVKDRGYATRTLEEIKFKLERYRQDLGDRLIGQLDVLAVAEYLDGFSNNAYTKHRGLLVQVFSFAVAKGLAERNVAELTLVKKEADKKRQRHTLEGLMKIVEAKTTPEWLKRAIRLGLASLQRREDIVSWLKTSVDMEANTIMISPGKTQGYENPIHLRIKMGLALREVVSECVRSPIASPYLIHYKPRARRQEQIASKDHWTSVTPNYLTKEFSKARDLAKAYESVPSGERPTFHEIRALGAWLYEQQKFPQDYIQALMGHSDVKMTKHYQEGHTDKVIEYVDVGADLAF
ncbi:tyrosine-type recombinase/integrase [Pseudomonas sp. RTB3]|uniref:tyrosine-type recombinase/integrase n=1 Tax=unclassified Pseudomonas TaxID=196821 RepID=UPI002B23B607|nr:MULTISPECIES: tyrosine-type recombinase/integrase [unclassified Pseudomonas]MEB0008173.1 tyrosine-type recombinase/integrase [Pseudomonas sp. RTB2]MEB0015895.1 tyrosine-type recombinase/integrase [Pseudomonas sp. RTB3]MEB0270891.1 tyrosine-type recombinase/integrase [Pseudomonas sp. 5B4]